MTNVDIAITTGIGADTEVRSFLDANKNYGVTTVLTLYQGASRKALLRFDLSSIPVGSICVSASLGLCHSSTAGINNTYSIYKITDANGDWVEGTKNAATAGTGEPCWNKKAYNTVNWAGSGGLETAGTDYINTVLATAETGDTGSFEANTFLPFAFNAEGKSVIESWFGLANNNGLVAFRTGGSNTGTFHSKQATTAGYRPVLSVAYTTGAKKYAIKKTL